MNQLSREEMKSGHNKGQPGSPWCHHGDNTLIWTPGFQCYLLPPLLCSKRERKIERVGWS